MDKCHKQYQLFQSANFIKNEKCPQTLSTTLIKVAMFWKMFSKAVYYFSKKSLSILFPKKLHLKFIRMKLLNRKNEARNSIKNINERSFVVQQEYLLAHFWDWWEDFEENLALELKIFNDSHTFFSSSKQDKQPKSTSLKRFFPTIIWFWTDHYGSWIYWKRHCSPGNSHKWLIGLSITSTLAEGSNCFGHQSNCGHLRVLHWKVLTLIRLSPREHAVSTKMISVKSCTCSVFCWPFQCSTTFESSTFQTLTFALVGKQILFSMFCKFSVFDGRYPLTIVHCPSRASSASRFCGVFVNKKRNTQLSQIF